ncbi:hypothetical protein [Schleiferilactobacillus harbinensis]|uniref:hypothetical protein n=1 Tax=Schleiferilactobacillus harbinensis TaxID=304207 RepID=UPI0011702932|nr:hypothetical protein [Schleiferilactobacillus harbinensis]MCT2909034.1 hypothetical protein [Schleiferilactobacillus harbinensis]GEK04799.1 hypothetical protein LHA01_00380 [Schleiferilactobacillus harbinensis]
MKIKGMLLFYVHRYLHSIYLILPLLLWFVFLTTNFAIAPQYFASAIGANALVLVLLMTWVAYAVNSIISDTALSIAAVQARSWWTTYWVKWLFFALVAGLFSLIGIIFPLVRWLAPGTPFFFEHLTGLHFLTAFLLMWTISMPGMAIGNFFNRHVVANRYFAVLLTILVLICGYITPTLAADYAWWHWVSWLLPPTGEALTVLNQFASLSNGQALLWAGIQLLYAGVVAGVSYAWQQRRKMA